jgi:hypothetical protein
LDSLVGSIDELVEISVEGQKQLTEIRNALVEGAGTDPANVDAVVITETAAREPPEAEF